MTPENEVLYNAEYEENSTKKSDLYLLTMDMVMLRKLWRFILRFLLLPSLPVTLAQHRPDTIAFD
jgi:hypothetical protein